MMQINEILKMPTWLVVIALSSIIFLVLLALITGREVTFWPPKIGAKVTTVKPAELTQDSAKKNDLPIDSKTFLISEKINLYTKWRLGKNKKVYEEYMDIFITNDIITGKRKTISNTNTVEYNLRGYKTQNNLRIEYFLENDIGGGQITLQKIVQGWYNGSISYLNCDSGLFKYYLNRWYDFDFKNDYEESFQKDIL